MPRPRILSSYNHKRRDDDEIEGKNVRVLRKLDTKKVKNDEPDCEIIIIDNDEGSKAAKKHLRRTTPMPATKQVRRDAGDDLEESEKLTRRMPLETKEAVTAVRQNSSLSLRLVTNATKNATRQESGTSVATTPVKVHQSTPVPRISRLPSNSSAKIGKLESDSSSRLARPVANSPTGATQSVSKTTATATQLTPQPAVISVRRTPSSAAKVSQSSASNAIQRVPGSSVTIARSMSNAGGAGRTVSVAQLVAASPTEVLRLVPSSSPHVMHLLADQTLEIGRLLPPSNKRIPQLVKMPPTRSSATPDSSIQSTKPKTITGTPRILENTRIQLPTRMIKGLDKSNIVMVLPVGGKDTNIFQNSSICTLQNIENSREVARVQQVVGVQRQPSQKNGKRMNEAKETSEPRKKDTHRVSLSDAKPKKELFPESKKGLISRESTKNSSGIATRSLSAGKSVIEKSKHHAKPIEVKKTPSKIESSPSSVTSSSRKRSLGNASSGDASTNVARTNPSVATSVKRNVRLATKANQKKSKLSNFAKTHARLTKVLANQPIHTPKNIWRARCIVCKERFTDKYEFHRHASLSHPGVRIVFCELCSAFFRHDDELRRHRITYHKVIVPKDTECAYTKVERSRAASTTPRTTTESRGKSLRTKITSLDDRRPIIRKKSTIVNGNSEAATGTSSENLRARSARKKITVSSVRTRNLRKLSQPTGLVGPRTRQLQKMNETHSTCNYVDVDVIDHDATGTKKKFKSTEIKKLIVPIERLEGVALEKYMFKLAKNPVTDFTTSLKSSLLSEAKTPGTSNETETSRCSGASSANEKVANPSALSGLGKMRKTRGSRNRARNERNHTITRETTNLNIPAQPRRSARRGIAKKSSFSSADETTDVEVVVVRSLDHNEASTSKGKSEVEETSITIDESTQVADIVREQQIIRKLVSRSSVSSCTTLELNRAKEDSNTPKRMRDNSDSESSNTTIRRAAIYTSSDESPSSAPIDVKKFLSSNRSISKQLSSSDDAPSRKFLENIKSRDLSLDLSSSSGERLLRGESSTSLNSDDTLFAHRLRSESARCSLKIHEFERQEKSKESNENAMDDEREENREEIKMVREADKPDEEKTERNTQSKDSVDGDNQRNDNTDGDEKQTEEKSNDAEKQSEDKSNRKEKKRDEIDDGNEKSRESLEDRDKDRDESMDDDEESREETLHVDDEENFTDEDEPMKKSTDRLEKQPGKKADVYKRSKRKLKDSNDTSFNDERNVEAKKRETEDPEKASSSCTFSNSRKTYSCSKKLSKITREQDERAEDQMETPQDLCSVCKELFILMKKVSSELDLRNKAEVPIKCPLCQRYFISMFHLKLHVSTNHLQCPNKIACEKAKLSSADETSCFTELDCVTVPDTLLECPRCATTFDHERDLNDHLIAQHETILPKDTASNELPEYLRDLHIGCIATTIPQSGYVASSQEKQSSTLDCSLCEEKFTKTAEYVRHLRVVHHKIESVSCSDQRNNSQQSSNDADPCFSLYGSQPEFTSTRDNEDADVVEESPRRDSNEQMTADRAYVLKQLLSDDSSDDTRKVSRHRRSGVTGKSDFPSLRRDTIVEKSDDKTIVGYISNFHSCSMCNKKFRRAHDLLIHSLYHADSETSKATGANVENFPSKETKNGEDTETIDRRVESDEAIVVYGANGASQKFTRGSKRRATTSLNASSSKIVKVTVPKQRKVIPESATSPATTGEQSRDTDKASMEELIDTSSIVPAEETNAKLPIACDKCNRHFANRSLLNEHLFFLHDDNLKDTVLTDILTSRGSRLNEKDKSLDSWRCDSCEQNFKLLQSYSRHRYYVHGDDTMVHVCENCSKVLTSVTMVNVHICTDVASYNCRTCNEGFSSGMTLRLHNTEKHTETIGAHKCVKCDKNFLTNAMLERHLKCKHRFVRPHRARKSSPVRMATPDTTNNEEKVNEPETQDNSDKEVKANEPVETRRGRWRACKGKKIVRERSPIAPKRQPAYRPPGKRKRGRPRKYPRSDDESSYRDSQDEDQDDEALDLIVPRQTTLYVDLSEIHQCSLCQLHCFTKSTLRNHMTSIHSVTSEICQLCQKPYTHGKLMRHVIDHHVTSDDGSVPELERPWSIVTNSNEIDTEILVKMLGIDRLVSLCEYRRYAEKIGLDTYPCLSCNATFQSHELYRYHFLLQHDSMCALCNIEFKTGHDAARHKNDVHGSVGRYIWFADRTVLAMTSTKNFAELTDRIFMERLTKGGIANEQETKETIDDDDDDDDDDADVGDDIENLDYTEILVYDKPGSGIVAKDIAVHEDHGINLMEKVVDTENITDRERNDETSNLAGQSRLVDDTIPPDEVLRTTSASNSSLVPTIARNKRTRQVDDSYSKLKNVPRIMSVEERSEENVVSYDFSEPDDVCLVIVVTDEDLERFNIATPHPNIWGLAAEISSTYEHITPKEVKQMLEFHFERQEDFDA